MDYLRKMIKSELRNYQLVETDFIVDYIEYILTKNKLTPYCHSIEFSNIRDNSSLAKYDYQKKKIVIDDDKTIECIIKNSYLNDIDFNKVNLEDIKFLFAMYLQIITHELVHVNQEKIMSSYSPSVLRDMLRDDFKITKKYYDFYLSNHDEFISEVNAENESCLFVGDLFAYDYIFKDPKMLDKYNSFAASVLLSGYTEHNGVVTYYPARFFYENFKEYDRGLLFNSCEDDCNYLRITEGLQISYDLFSKLNEVKNGASTPNIKKLVLTANKLKK